MTTPTTTPKKRGRPKSTGVKLPAKTKSQQRAKANPAAPATNSIPVNPFNSPALALAYKPLVSLSSHFDRGVETKTSIYVPTSAYGHFGRKPTTEGHFTWEKTDLVDSFKNAF